MLPRKHRSDGISLLRSSYNRHCGSVFVIVSHLFVGTTCCEEACGEAQVSYQQPHECAMFKVGPSVKSCLQLTAVLAHNLIETSEETLDHWAKLPPNS